MKDTLELQVQAQAKDAKNTVDSLVKSLTNIENVLTNVYLDLGNIEKKQESTSKAPKNINKINISLTNLKNTANKTSSSFDKLAKSISYIGMWQGVRKLSSAFVEMTGTGVDYAEQLNLFNVVFKNIEKNGVTTYSKLGLAATKYQNKLNEAFGTNKTETLYTQAIYQSMGENVGIPKEYAAIMSETMANFTYDLASLYNKEEKYTAEALRAGVYAGQTKPLRAYGIDVTQTSMQPILDELGINKQVKDLSQAEKEILRYIATLRQGSVAMGDFANTIESPANQMKIFKQQLVEVKVAVSSLFIDTFGKILPYANALLMVTKEITSAIATFFGIKITDYNSGIADQSGAYADLGDEIDNTTDSIKELKKQAFGFDEIHNVNENSTPTNEVSGGIDQRLLDAITGYDNGMGKVRMKAVQIRDTLMEWLGFTKEVNEETEKISFTYDMTNKTIPDVTKEIAENLANSLNDFTKNLNVGDFVSNVCEYINAGLIGINTFVKNYDWASLGKTIADGLNSALHSIKWDEVGKIFTNKLRILINTADGFFSNVDWTALGSSAATGISSALANIPVKNLAHGINALAKGLFEAFKTFMAELDWKEVGNTIVTFLTELDWQGYVLLAMPVIIKGLSSGFSILKSSILSSITKIFQNKTDSIFGVASSASGAIGGGEGFNVPDLKTVGKGLADIGLIVGGATLFVEALGLLNKIPGWQECATTGIESLTQLFAGIAKIIIPLSGLSLLTGILSKINPGEIAKGLADLAIIIGGMEAIIVITGALMSIEVVGEWLTTGIESLVSTFEALGQVFLPLAGITTGVVALGTIITGSGGIGFAAIAAGLVGLAEVIAGLEVILVAVGALNQIPGFSWLVGEGGKALCQIGSILGGFVGSIVEGFGNAILGLLDDVGIHLSNFMKNAQPFFDGLKNVKANTLKAVGYLASAILKITASQILDGVASFLTGGSSLTKFGKELKNFAPSFVEFAKQIKNVDAEAVTASANAAKSLAELVNNLPNSGGVAQFFAGSKDLIGFTKTLPELGENLKSFAESVDGVEPALITESATAAQSISELQKSLPDTGGVAQLFTGSKNLAGFTATLPELGENMKAYAESVDGINPDTIINSATAAMSISELQKSLPSEDGIVQLVTGCQDLAKFAETLPTLGENMKSYGESVSGLDTDMVINSATAAMSIAELANNLPPDDGFFQKIAGSQSLTDFANSLPALGKSMKTYGKNIKGLDADAVLNSARAAKSLAEFYSSLPPTGGLLQLATGAPDMNKFAKELPALGTSLKKYGKNVTGLETDVVLDSMKAAQSINEFYNSLPPTGGLKQLAEGAPNMNKFAKELPSLGTSLTSYYKAIEGIKPEIVTKSADAASALAAFNDRLPESGGWVQWMIGEKNIADFGWNLKYFGLWFKDYYDYIAGMSFNKLTNINTALITLLSSFLLYKNNGLQDVMNGFGETLKNTGEKMKSFFSNTFTVNSANSTGTQFGTALANSMKKAFKNNFNVNIGMSNGFGLVSQYKLYGYANGGAPSHGTMFVAGERGAEIVGNINGRTEVLNQSQIASAVYSAVASAMSQYGGQSEIDVHLHTDEGVIVDRINQKTKQTGVCPITIPV